MRRFFHADRDDTSGGECEETSTRHNHRVRRAFSRIRNWQPTSLRRRQPIKVERGERKEHIIHKRWHSIACDNGAIHNFCSDDCLDEYTENVDADDETYAVVRTPPFQCVCCHWCGQRMHQPDHCILHGDHCPTANWKLTHQASVCYQALSQFTNGNIPEGLEDDCEHMATTMSSNLDGRLIAQTCWVAWKLFE